MTRILKEQGKILAELRQNYPGLIRNSNYVGLSNENAVVQSVNEGQMKAKFTIVTRQASPNLHNNKVQITPSKAGRGMILDIHKGAPNVLFEHGESYLGNIPVGVSEDGGRYTVRKYAKKATAEVVFSQALPDAQLIFALVAEGTMRMASIGFIPTMASAFEVQQAESEDGEVQQVWPPPVGMDFHESLLLEWSIVSTGADPGAFKQALSRGTIHGEKLTPQFGMLCQSLAGESGLVVPGWGIGTQNDPDTATFSDECCEPALCTKCGTEIIDEEDLGDEADPAPDVLCLLDDEQRLSMLKDRFADEASDESMLELCRRTEGCNGERLQSLCDFIVDCTPEEDSVCQALSDYLDDLEGESISQSVAAEEVVAEQPELGPFACDDCELIADEDLGLLGDIGPEFGFDYSPDTVSDEQSIPELVKEEVLEEAVTQSIDLVQVASLLASGLQSPPPAVIQEAPTKSLDVEQLSATLLAAFETKFGEMSDAITYNVNKHLTRVTGQVDD